MAAVLFLPGGCATYPQKNFRSQETYGKGYDQVWDTVVVTLNGMNMDIKTMEKTRGRIEVEGPGMEMRKYVLGRYDSIYCYCVVPHQRNDIRELVGNYAIALTRDGDSRTSVIIDATFLASVYDGETFSGWLPCPSKGIFEPFFLNQVEARLNAVKTPPPPPPPPKEERKTPPRNLDWWKPSRGY